MNSINPQARPSATISNSVTAEWQDGLDNLSKLLDQAQSNLTELEGRMFGEAGAADGLGPSAVSSGRAETIGRLISRLTNQAQELSNTASRLNTRI